MGVEAMTMLVSPSDTGLDTVDVLKRLLDSLIFSSKEFYGGLKFWDTYEPKL